MTLDKVTVALKLLSTDAPRVFCENTLALRTGWSWQCCLKSVRDILAEKHPLAVSDFLFESDSIDAPCYNPVLFEQLTGDLIRWTALCTHSAAAGPSDVGAYA